MVHNSNVKMRTPIHKNKCLVGGEYSGEVIKLINDTVKSIEIVMFDWRWYGEDPTNPMQLINNALVRAVRRGVTIRALTGNKKIVPLLIQQGIMTKKINKRGLLHSKLLILDSELIVLGSHNLTGSAMYSNIETSMIIPCKESAQQFIEFFKRLWQL